LVVECAVCLRQDSEKGEPAVDGPRLRAALVMIVKRSAPGLLRVAAQAALSLAIFEHLAQDH
jgi:hypothetical protein